MIELKKCIQLFFQNFFLKIPKKFQTFFIKNQGKIQEKFKKKLRNIFKNFPKKLSNKFKISKKIQNYLQQKVFQEKFSFFLNLKRIYNNPKINHLTKCLKRKRKLEKIKICAKNGKKIYNILDFLNKHLENFTAWLGGGSKMFTIIMIA